jgi:hypothetical protein
LVHIFNTCLWRLGDLVPGQNTFPVSMMSMVPSGASTGVH